MKILNFGSLNIDYVYSVRHFVAAGETSSSLRLQKFCGGKGLNQSVALARAGGSVFHAGIVGAESSMLTDVLAASGVDISLLEHRDVPNGHAIIQVDEQGQNAILLHGGTNRMITPELARKVLAQFGEGDFLVLQNEISALPEILRMGKERGMRIFLNPSPIDPALLEMPLTEPDCLLLNEVEGNAFTGETEPESMMEALEKRFPGKLLVLTLGKHGVLCRADGRTFTHGVYPMPVVNTTGAGDTFTGYFIASLFSDCDLPEALRRASVASSLAVSADGAAESIPLLEQVLEYQGEEQYIK